MSCRTLSLLLAALTLCAGPCLHAAEDLDAQVARATKVAAGQAAPDFTCQTTAGRAINLAALKGKVVVLYFFSTRVGTCLVEMRNLEREIMPLVRGREEVLVLGLGRGHTREELLQLAAAQRLSFPLAADADAGIFGRYFTKFVPRTVVVGRDGAIVRVFSGYDEVKGVTPLRRVLVELLE